MIRSSERRRYISPLRYPGGKARMASFLADVFADQVGLLDVEVWVEPFAGGAGAGLTLLERDVVGEVWLFEANPGLAALWQTLTSDPLAFADVVAQTRPTLALYQRSSETLAALADGQDVPTGDASLAAFVVNRCSRSGIIAPRVGPIGGKAQSSKWTLDARFDPDRLAERIRALAPLMGRVRFLGTDGIAGIADLDGDVGVEDEVLLFVDPPYLREGPRLYAHGMDASAHQRLADALNGTPARWVLTYDDERAIPDRYYPHRRVVEFDIAHTAAASRVDREYLVLSPTLTLPGTPGQVAPSVMRTGSSRWVRQQDQQCPSSLDAAG